MFTYCGEILLSTFSLKIDEPSLARLVLVCETQSTLRVAFFQVTSRDPELFGDRYSLLHSPSGKKLLADISQRHHLPKLSPTPIDWEHQGTRPTSTFSRSCPGVGASLQREQTLSFGCIHPIPQFPRELQMTFFTICSGLLSIPTHPPQGCQLQAPMAKCSGHVPDCCPLPPKLTELNYRRTCPLGTVLRGTRIQKQWQGKMEGLGRKMQSWIG